MPDDAGGSVVWLADLGHDQDLGGPTAARVRKVEPLTRALGPLNGWITGQRKDQSPGTRANVPIPIGMEFDRSDCTYGCTVTKATLANTFWGLEYRPMKEQTQFYSINPGFEWRLAENWTIDGHVNKTRSTFYRDMPTVMLATRSPNSVIQYDNTVPGQPPTYTGNQKDNLATLAAIAGVGLLLTSCTFGIGSCLLPLLIGGIVGLTHFQGHADRLLPLLRRTIRTRACPVQEVPELFILVLNSGAGKANSTKCVDLVHGDGDL